MTQPDIIQTILKDSNYHRKDPNYFEEITDIPNVDQTLADILNECFTLKDKLAIEWLESVSEVAALHSTFLFPS